jgi:hypothetical protein
MQGFGFLFKFFLSFSFFVANGIATAQPKVGQAGKDVIWVPTPQALVDRMLDMAKVTPKDYVIDLGSGDGRTVITAAKRGIKAHGIEYDLKMVELAKRNAEKEGVSALATFERGDIFKSDFSRATVITLFLLPNLNVKLRPTLLDMKPGTRVASNSFNMGDWSPDQTIKAGGECKSWCTAYLWIIPAKVEGTWKLSTGELTLKQDYQMISGTLKSGNEATIIAHAQMNGSEISFTADDRQFSGRVNGSTIEGSVKSRAGLGSWRATRQ